MKYWVVIPKRWLLEMMRSSRQWGEVSNNINWLLCVAAFPTLLCDCTVDFEIFFSFFFFLWSVYIGAGWSKTNLYGWRKHCLGWVLQNAKGEGEIPQIPQTKPQSGKALSPVLGSDCYPLFLLLIRADEARARGWRTQRSLPMSTSFCVVGAKLSTPKPRCLVEVSNSLA